MKYADNLALLQKAMEALKTIDGRSNCESYLVGYLASLIDTETWKRAVEYSLQYAKELEQKAS